MKNKEIITILLLVAFAFSLVGILQYFNLYEGLESGTVQEAAPEAAQEVVEPEKKDDKATIIKYDF
jgi:hypothetical protein